MDYTRLDSTGVDSTRLDQLRTRLDSSRLDWTRLDRTGVLSLNLTGEYFLIGFRKGPFKHKGRRPPWGGFWAFPVLTLFNFFFLFNFFNF